MSVPVFTGELVMCMQRTYNPGTGTFSMEYNGFFSQILQLLPSGVTELPCCFRSVARLM